MAGLAGGGGKDWWMKNLAVLTVNLGRKQKMNLPTFKGENFVALNPNSPKSF